MTEREINEAVARLCRSRHCADGDLSRFSQTSMNINGEILRHELRRAWTRARDPGPIDYKLLAWGRVLVVIGLGIAVAICLAFLKLGLPAAK